MTMKNDAAQMDRIPAASKSSVKKTQLFTSAVSATAIVALFVVLGVMLLERI